MPPWIRRWWISRRCQGYFWLNISNVRWGKINHSERYSSSHAERVHAFSHKAVWLVNSGYLHALCLHLHSNEACAAPPPALLLCKLLLWRGRANIWVICISHTWFQSIAPYLSISVLHVLCFASFLCGQSIKQTHLWLNILVSGSEVEDNLTAATKHPVLTPNPSPQNKEVWSFWLPLSKLGCVYMFLLLF